MDLSPSSNAEIRALAQLLDDPDPIVQSSIWSRLEELGRTALPPLLDARDGAEEPLRSEIDAVVHDLHLDDVEQAWTAVMGADTVNLERGAFLLALYRFPRLDIPVYRAKLDRLAERVRPNLDGLLGIERGLALAKGMHEDLGFRGNKKHYHDPNNSYLNRVIERHLGIPISLSVIYLLLAERLDVEAYGANMPAHFLVKCPGASGEVFIDCFDDGQYLTKDACVRFLLKLGVTPRTHYFEAASPRTILLRMGRNLLAIARDNDQAQMADDLLRLLEPWDPSLDE